MAPVSSQPKSPPKTKPQPSSDSENSGGRVVVLTVLGLAVLVGGAYVAAYAFAGEKVPRGTEVAGIAIGGKSHDDAVQALEEGFADRETLEVTVDGQSVPMSAAETPGLSVDYDASVDEAGGGRSWAPGRLWDYYTGGDDLDPVLVVDDAAPGGGARRGSTRSTARRPGRATSGSRAATRPRSRHATARRSTARRPAEALEAAYVDGGTAELTLAKAEPDISEADVQDALNEFANPAVSGPVTLVFDKTRVTLRPADFAPALGMKPEDGALVPDLDEKKLAAVVRGRFARTDGAPGRRHGGAGRRQAAGGPGQARCRLRPEGHQLGVPASWSSRTRVSAR